MSNLVKFVNETSEDVLIEIGNSVRSAKYTIAPQSKHKSELEFHPDVLRDSIITIGNKGKRVNVRILYKKKKRSATPPVEAGEASSSTPKKQGKIPAEDILKYVKTFALRKDDDAVFVSFRKFHRDDDAATQHE